MVTQYSTVDGLLLKFRKVFGRPYQGVSRPWAWSLSSCSSCCYWLLAAVISYWLATYSKQLSFPRRLHHSPVNLLSWKASKAVQRRSRGRRILNNRAIMSFTPVSVDNKRMKKLQKKATKGEAWLRIFSPIWQSKVFLNFCLKVNDEILRCRWPNIIKYFYCFSLSSDNKLVNQPLNLRSTLITIDSFLHFISSLIQD